MARRVVVLALGIAGLLLAGCQWLLDVDANGQGTDASVASPDVRQDETSAPIADAAVDSAVPDADAALDSGPADAGHFPCDRPNGVVLSCRRGTETCCFGISDPSYCANAGTACGPGMVVTECATHADCAPGLVCCGIDNPASGYFGSVECRTAANCNPPNQFACTAAKDCDAAVPCSTYNEVMRKCGF